MTAEEQNDDLFDENDGDLSDGAGSGTEESAPQGSDGAANDSKDSKRINDLMSAMQKEQARANRLESELAKLKGQGSGSDGETKTKAQSARSERDELEQFIRDNARKDLFRSDPSLEAAGLTVDDIEGNTLAEMRASLAAKKKFVERVESSARNRILSEHGLTPDIGTSTGGSERLPDFSSMSSEDFEKFVSGL